MNRTLKKLLSDIITPIIYIFTVSRNKDKGRRRSGELIEDITIPSRYLMGGEGRYTVYLPAGWKTSGKKYPVLYAFHGVGDDGTKLEYKGDITAFIDKAWADGVCGEFITVMPNGMLSFYVDGMDFMNGEPGHMYDSFFNNELRPDIETRFPVLAGKDNCAICGMSMGGYGAFRQCIVHPENYALCYCMSGATNGMNWSDTTDKAPSVEHMLEKRLTFEGRDSVVSTLPRIVMDCGTCDPIVRICNENTHRRLSSMGIPHIYITSFGSHSWTFWKKCFTRMMAALPF